MHMKKNESLMSMQEFWTAADAGTIDPRRLSPIQLNMVETLLKIGLMKKYEPEPKQIADNDSD